MILFKARGLVKDEVRVWFTLQKQREKFKKANARTKKT